MSDFQGETGGQQALSGFGIFGIVAFILLAAAVWMKRAEFSIPEIIAYPFRITTGLLPFLIFAAGPIIDVINKQPQYSIASGTGLLSILYTSFIGSQKFTDFSTSVFGIFGNDTWYKKLAPFAIILAIYAAVGGSLAGTGYLTTSVTAVVGMSLLIVPMILAQFGLLRTESVMPIPITSLPGKIAAWASGTPIVAAAATGGGMLEVSGDACILSGYDGFEVPLAPSSVTLPMTVLLCHLIEYLDTQNYGGAAAVGGLAATVFVFQAGSFWANDCRRYYSSGKGAPFIALAISGIFAGSIYGILKYYNGGTENFGTDGIFHPTTAAPPPKTKTAGKSDILIKTSGAAVTASADLFEKADDEDYEEVVGMLFKDGEPISDVSILKS